MTPSALQRADVDWHLPQLYDFAARDGRDDAGRALYARHVVDLNRPPQDESLYPGQDVTGLLPMDTFRKEPLYLPGEAPDAAERDERRASATGSRTTTRCAPSSSGCAHGTAAWCCGTRTRSAACCRASSRASCPT